MSMHIESLFKLLYLALRSNVTAIKKKIAELLRYARLKKELILLTCLP